MNSTSLKTMLHDAKGQANLPMLVITIAVIGVMGVIGIAIFNQANRTALAPTNVLPGGGSCPLGQICTVNNDSALLGLAPLAIAAIIVIGGIASLAYIMSRGM